MSGQVNPLRKERMLADVILPVLEDQKLREEAVMLFKEVAAIGERTQEIKERLEFITGYDLDCTKSYIRLADEKRASKKGDRVSSKFGDLKAALDGNLITIKEYQYLVKRRVAKVHFTIEGYIKARDEMLAKKKAEEEAAAAAKTAEAEAPSEPPSEPEAESEEDTE